jgi:hypothetical protein
LLLPLAVFGLVRIVRSSERSQPLVSILVGTFLLLLVAVLRGVFDWGLAGNATLLHQGRVWPAAHLLAGVLAGHALGGAFAGKKRRSVDLAFLGVAAVFVAGAVSLVVARESLHEVMEARQAGYEYASPDIRDASGFLRQATPFLGPDDVVEVVGSDRLAFRLFEFSGAKIARFDDPRLGSNDLRIRYEHLAEAWDERMAEGGFDADFVARRSQSPGPDEELLTSGTFGGESWSLFRVD